MQNTISLGAFLVTALVLAGLVARLRRSAVESGRLSQQHAALSQEQAALRRVATLVARGAPPPEVFSAVAHALAEQFGASITAVLRYQDDGTATIVGGWAEPGVQIPIGVRLKTAGQGADSALRTGAAVRVERFDGPTGSAAGFFREAGMITGTGSPIMVDGRLWGVAIAGSRNADAFPAGTETRIADFTELVATAIANAETQAQLIESRARLVAAADQTRQKIERDLHDGAQQRLVSLALQELRMAQAAVPPELPELGADLERVTAGLTTALDELREYARGIHPAALTERGLGSALRALARRCPIPVDLDIRVDGRLPEPIEVAAYYVVSEALTNAAKHADSPQAAVSVEATAGVLRVSVRDDGCGDAGLHPRHRPGRPQGPRRGARRPDVPLTARLAQEPRSASNCRSPTATLLIGETRGRPLTGIARSGHMIAETDIYGFVSVDEVVGGGLRWGSKCMALLVVSDCHVVPSTGTGAALMAAICLSMPSAGVKQKSLPYSSWPGPTRLSSAGTYGGTGYQPGRNAGGSRWGTRFGCQVGGGRERGAACLTGRLLGLAHP